MLPPELNGAIFELACSDGGATARSLCLVSKYIRAVAAPYLCTSLAVSGPAHLLALATRLEAYPNDARLVRHLFLSDRPHSSPQSSSPSYPIPDPEATAFHTLTLRIMSLVAPHLETLTLLLFHHDAHHIAKRITDVLALPHPQLTSLTLHTPHSLAIPFPRTFPALSHLHLSGLTLTNLSPKPSTFTHLRLTGLPGANSNSLLVQIERLALSRSPPSSPPPLRRVIIQPEWMPTRWRWGSMPSSEELFGLKLQRLARLVGTPRFLLIPKPKHKETSDDVYARLKGDWVAWIGGKPGCWGP
ncbi:hypothetical protein BOTBODRAFT_38742 [Botryobasidium botryosum FD-172 SS1]|uniref:F-box domain-containing protein n=1 Tax=Botryobasidium botryosum (strain FD-172 SS1) TaxID=930990 RepID=A0A067LYT8_BOTB1|nr:hypothetical protein BOTBODRAFT_38742 [Botryobasidium botryosum FD-172 SS1]